MSIALIGTGPYAPPPGARICRVSRIDSFKRWLAGDPRVGDRSMAEFIAEQLTPDDVCTPEQAAGRAFHAGMENLGPGEHEVIEADGFRFHLPDCELALPRIREIRCAAEYGPLYVTGQVDLYDALLIEDYKTSAHGFSAEYYLSGWQWRFYLDIFDALRFRWHVFRIRERKGEPQVFDVDPPEVLEAVRYRGMHAECVQAARDYFDFVQAHFPLEHRYG